MAGEGEREGKTGEERYREYTKKVIGAQVPSDTLRALPVVRRDIETLTNQQTNEWVRGLNKYNQVKHSVKRVMDRLEIPSHKRKLYYKFADRLWELEIKNKEGEFVIRNRTDLDYLKARFRRRNEEMSNAIMDAIIEEIISTFKV